MSTLHLPKGGESRHERNAELGQHSGQSDLAKGRGIMDWTRRGLAPLLALLTGCNNVNPAVDARAATDSQNATSRIDQNESATEGQKLSFASFDRTPTAIEWGESEDQFTVRLKGAQQALGISLYEFDQVIEEYKEALATRESDEILKETYDAMWQARTRVETSINEVLSLPIGDSELLDYSCELCDNAFEKLLSSVTLLTSEDQQRGCPSDGKIEKKRQTLEEARMNKAKSGITKI